MKKLTVLMAAVLVIAAATMLAAGPAALGSNGVPEAQANPCGNIVNTPSQSPGDTDVDCKIIGPVDIFEVPLR
jgi:hypothetical protein